MRQRRQNRQFYNQEGFVYNPGDDIRRNLAIGAQGFDKAFKQSSEKADWEYNQIKETFDNVDVIAESFNEYHSDILNKEVQGIEQGVSASILENGKLDYSRLGEVNKAVRRLKTMQNNSQNAVKSYKNAVELMQSNIGNMRSPVETQLKMKAILESPEALASPRDAGKQIDELYQEGVDWELLLNKRIVKGLGDKPKKIVPVSYIDKSTGDQVSFNAIIVPGVTKWDPEQNRIVEEKIVDENGNEVGALSSLKKSFLTGPEAEGYRKYIIGPAERAGKTVEDGINSTIDQVIQSGISDLKITKRQELIDAQNKSISLAAKASLDTQKAKNEQARFDTWLSNIESQINTREGQLQVSQGNLGIRAEELGLKVSDFKKKLKETGWVEDSDGNLVHNPEGDILQKNRIELKKTASTVKNAGILGKIESAEEKKNKNNIIVGEEDEDL